MLEFGSGGSTTFFSQFVESWVSSFEESVIRALEKVEEFCFENAYDDVNDGLLPLHQVKRERHEEVSFMVKKNIFPIP